MENQPAFKSRWALGAVLVLFAFYVGLCGLSLWKFNHKTVATTPTTTAAEVTAVPADEITPDSETTPADDDSAIDSDTDTTAEVVQEEMEFPAAVVPPASLPTARVLNYGTLYGMAKRLCGDGARWTEILELNPGLDPAKLVVNQVLTLPADCQMDTRQVPAQLVITHPATPMPPSAAPPATPPVQIEEIPLPDAQAQVNPPQTPPPSDPPVHNREFTEEEATKFVADLPCSVGFQEIAAVEAMSYQIWLDRCNDERITPEQLGQIAYFRHKLDRKIWYWSGQLGMKEAVRAMRTDFRAAAPRHAKSWTSLEASQWLDSVGDKVWLRGGVYTDDYLVQTHQEYLDGLTGLARFFLSDLDAKSTSAPSEENPGEKAVAGSE